MSKPWRAAASRATTDSAQVQPDPGRGLGTRSGDMNQNLLFRVRFDIKIIFTEHHTPREGEYTCSKLEERLNPSVSTPRIGGRNIPGVALGGPADDGWNVVPCPMSI